MNEPLRKNRVLSDEQLLALSFEDLCDLEYLQKLQNELCSGDEEFSDRKHLERITHPSLVSEDLLNFADDASLAIQLFRKRMLLEATIPLAPNAMGSHYELLSRQVFVYRHIARVVHQGRGASSSTRLDAALPAEDAKAPFLQDLIFDVMRSSSSVGLPRDDLRKFHSSVDALVSLCCGARSLAPAADYAPRVVEFLGTHFSRSFAMAVAGKGSPRESLESLKLAGICCVSTIKVTAHSMPILKAHCVHIRWALVAGARRCSCLRSANSSRSARRCSRSSTGATACLCRMRARTS